MTGDETAADLVAAIEALLVRTEQAHGVFESAELGVSTTRDGRAGTRCTPSSTGSASSSAAASRSMN